MKLAVQPRPRVVIAALTTLLLAGSGLTLGVSAASAAPGDVSAATLQWGFKQSFRSYITGPIAHGKWTLSGGVTDATPFGWSAGSGDADDTSGSVTYPGGIHFQGHESTAGTYDLDLDLTGVTIERTGADSASIIVDITTNSLDDPAKFTTYSDVEFATVDLGAAADDSTDTTIAFSGAPAVLTADGAEAFSGFYETGAALDPVSLSWPVEQATDPTDPEPQPEVPSITVSKTRNLDRAGETVTITGKNFVADGSATDAIYPPLAGGFGGAYVAFGRYPSAWKPSAGADSADRVNGDVKWLVNAADLEKVGGESAGAVALDDDGSFTTTLDVEPGYFSEPSSGTYGIYTYGGGGSAYAGFETATTVRFAAVTATSVKLRASASRVTAGASVTLSATVSPKVDGTLVITSGSKKLVTSTSGSTRISVTKLTAGTHTYDAVFTPKNPDVYAKSSDDVSVTARAATVGVGSLRWGIKQSFREYVTGPIAKGAIATTGASTSGGEFGFGQATGGTFEKSTGRGTSKYSGSVRFTGHAGLLDLSLSDPVVRIDSATSATLLVRVNGAAASTFATLDLSRGTRSTPNGTVAYTEVPAVLTAGGASVFSYKGSAFYQAGTALDPVTFVIGSEKAAPSTNATVASFETKKSAAATVPASAGITLDGSTELVAGDEVTATADGFEPNEQDVLVVIYSSPTVLADNATADASGRVTWTGALPTVLTGTHTLTFQGSVDRGVELTIAATATTSADSCPVTDATIIWGFKESFRSYISGSIANGKWEVADGATYDVPNFGFAGGTGSYDGTAGTLAFEGSITFTGHDGILDTAVANPSVRFGGDTAVLYLDVSGTTQEGEAVSATDVEFVTLDVSGATTADGVMTIIDAPATLAAGGAAAFGTYETGEEFDPVTMVFTTDAECGVAAAPVTEETTAPTATTETPIAVQPVASETVPVWAWAIIALLALILAAAIVLIVLTIRRPRATP